MQFKCLELVELICIDNKLSSILFKKRKKKNYVGRVFVLENLRANALSLQIPFLYNDNRFYCIAVYVFLIAVFETLSPMHDCKCIML